MNFTDIEYSKRKKKTRREEFLDQMEKVVPWDVWVNLIVPFYPNGKRGRKPQQIERMLRMMLLQNWFNLSDEGIEDAIYDSYAMRSFLRLTFMDDQVPDATTLCKFRKLLNDHGIQTQIFAQVQVLLAQQGKSVHGGTIVDATIVEAPSSTKNADHERDPEMHSVRKNGQYYFGMRAHIGVDPLYGFTHSLVCTPANAAEGKVAPQLLRPDDEVVYGDAGYLKMDKYVEDGIQREYRINLQEGTFKRHYGDGLAWAEEKKLEKLKTKVRRKVEFVFHIVKDIFGWRKTRYKGIHKNSCHAHLLFASANLYMLAKHA